MYKIKFGIVVFMLLLLCTACGRTSYFESTGQAENLQDSQDAGSYGTGQESSDEDSDASDTFQSEAAGIYVQVSGAVEKPGVYQMAEGDRVFQAIALAGGLTEEADETELNQAQTVTDGMKICVYTYAQTAAISANAAEDGKVNLNTATEEELCTLPGIGASKAKAILDYREKNGSFSSPEDLMQISGIKEGVYEQIADLVVTN